MASIRIAGCTGALVAGGKATRMGGLPKGLLRVDGEPVAGRALRLFRALFDDALVVANDPAPYAALGARVIPDAIPGKGAPSGVHAALAAASTGWVFTAACDMPFLAEAPIAFLAGLRAGAPAVVVRWGGRLQPLHALWSRACLPVLEAELRAGDPSLQGLALRVGARIVEEAEWRAVDPLGRAFENANTPEDAARLGLSR
ncbi:molybdenum cofactor guanylyltransferase [Anaeromyxobacter dehalogenans]|uniref:Probable molybdenum cofactor guanylyltransferase n=1 Tax=Anaeromyxobacter dehalogenans (strain 2CP-C) TaxID=290397 RepID=Q2IF91_ANADE|nr:molybdenum cofactor guanylyltransferase [Anaeromyxobacter dehalogenans]ABC83248.1 molybdenum cofactor guanylyltransferase [Anaeromyxobacter dehalogenans 2CP-C]